MNLADLMVDRYERDFGEGSWAELEAGVRSRHPDVFEMLDILEKPCLPQPKWWQFWK